jgi:hypothetical protein
VSMHAVELADGLSSALLQWVVASADA